jgi:hypothetical protein
MKLSHLFAMALVVGFAYVPSAQAVAVDPCPSFFGSPNVMPLGTLVAPASGCYHVNESTADLNVHDAMDGSLAPNTMITITYSYAGLSPWLLSVDANGANGEGASVVSVSAISGDSGSVVDSSSVNPFIIVLAKLDLDNSLGIAIIKNLSSVSASFHSIFNAEIDNPTYGGNVLVSYGVTPVPLPPAFLLFASCVIALAGFSMYRKARSQA